MSNSRNYRMVDTVPLLIPEVNADHLKLLALQAEAQGWKGRIVTNPNCSTVAITMALAPLRQFGIDTTMVTTLAGNFGCGYPGVPSWDILGNIIPYISGEEEKIETETKKILGSLGRGRIDDHPVRVARRRPACSCAMVTAVRSPSARPEADAGSGHRRVAFVPRPPAGTRPADRTERAGGVSGRSEPSAAGARRRS